MTDLFKFNDYKDYLKQLVKINEDIRGYQARLAREASCQPSYLSQVLTANADLTTDHALNLSTFLGFDDLEKEYLLTLIMLAKAASVKNKRYFEKKLSQLRKQHSSLTKRINSDEEYAKDVELIYHSSWVYAAVHVATSIQGQTAIAIAEKLRLTVGEVLSVLKILAGYGLVKSDGDKWIYVTGSTHLPDESYMTMVNHSNWRLKSVSNIPQRNENDLRYTSVFTMSQEDADKLKEEMLKVIKQWRGKIAPSQPEVTMAILCDFFEV